MTELRNYVHSTQTSLSALARRVGVSASQLSRVAAGKSAPSAKLAGRLETITGGRVNAGRLLGIPAEPAQASPQQRQSHNEGSLAKAIADARRIFADRRNPREHSADQLRAERRWEFHKEETEIAEMKLDVHRS